MNRVLPPWWQDFMMSVDYYIEQLAASVVVKGLIAFALMLYVDIFHGSVLVLDTYFLFAVIDLVLGMGYAVRQDKWSSRYIFYWMRKMVAYTGLVMLFGGLCASITATAGLSFKLVNWLLLCCIITELGSILKNLKKLGVPLPPLFEVLLKLLRRNVTDKLADTLGADDIAKAELEKAIAGGKLTEAEIAQAIQEGRLPDRRKTDQADLPSENEVPE